MNLDVKDHSSVFIVQCEQINSTLWWGKEAVGEAWETVCLPIDSPSDTFVIPHHVEGIEVCGASFPLESTTKSHDLW